MFDFLFLLLVAGVVLPTILLVAGRRAPITFGLFGVSLLLLVLFLLSAAADFSVPAVLVVLALIGLGALLLLLLWPARGRPGAAGAARPWACPPVGLLGDLLAERLPPREHARVAAHLEACTACQHRVEGLTAGQEFWDGVARELGRKSPTPAPALRQVIDRLKSEPDPEATGEAPACPPDWPLGFLSPPDKPGQLGRLARYEVLEEIGRGGMGVVLKAFDPSLHRVVAVKVLAPQLATSGVARQRFLREAKAAAAVTHDHIVTIHAVDEANGLPYLVMQYVAGRSLQERLDQEGPLTELTEVVRIALQTASGLAAAHAHGVVHRDVKPANILLEEGVQRVKITDFGLARVADDASLTQSGVVAGSPLYMAPEQARGEALDHRADLFSLGSLLYTMCAGRPPFRAPNALAVLRRVCEDVPRPLREINPEVPDWLAAVVERLMAKDPADRFQSAAEVVEVLGRHLARLQHGAWVPPPAADSPAAGGLPRTVTLCPACGASLLVSDRMVGGVVHCGECGEPFRVEDGSVEIQVARPVPSPFRQRPRPRPRKKLPRWAWGLAGCAALAGVLLLLAGRSAHTPSPVAIRDPRLTVGSAEVAERGRSWESKLAWVPAGATVVGAVDLEALRSLGLDTGWAEQAARLAFPAGSDPAAGPVDLGRVRIDRLSAAYGEGPKSEGPRGVLRLEGLALNGRQRVIDRLRAGASGGVRVEGDPRGVRPGDPVRVSGPGLPFAAGLLDDRRVFLARSAGRGSREADHLDALEALPGFDFAQATRPVAEAPSGSRPAWLQAALREIPPDACALVLGEVPAGWRSLLTEGLGLRACQRTFALSLVPEHDGVTVCVSLDAETAEAERTLLEALEGWRHVGPGTLQARHASLREEPESLALLERALTTARWEADPGSRRVRGRVQLPGEAWGTLGRFLERASRSWE